MAVNYADHQSQCYVRLPVAAPRGAVTLVDAMGTARFDRDADDLAAHGLFLDMPAWGYHVLEVVIN